MNSPTLSLGDIVCGVLAYFYSSRIQSRRDRPYKIVRLAPAPARVKNTDLSYIMSLKWLLTPRGSRIPADVFHTSGECSPLFAAIARLHYAEIWRNVPHTLLNFNILGCTWVLVRQSTITRQRLQHQACDVVLSVLTKRMVSYTRRCGDQAWNQDGQVSRAPCLTVKPVIYLDMGYDTWHALAWSCVPICLDLFLSDPIFF